MDAKWMRRLALGPVLVAAALAWSGAHAQEVPLVTGEHWVKSSEPVKKAYLVGMANILQVEAAHQAGNAPTDAQSIVARAVRGLRGHTLDGVRERLDRWYAANPDRLQRPVVETLWFEMVMPGLQSQR